MDWFVKIKQWFLADLWNEEMIQNAVIKGKLSQEQAVEILSSEEK